MAHPEVLFAQGHLGDALRAQEQKLMQAAQAIPAAKALGHGVDELAAELLGEFQVAPLVIDWDGMTASQTDTRVDVSRDQNRVIFDRSQPFYISGTTVTYHVPFRGESDLFKMQPSSYTLNPPRGAVSGGELQVSVTVPAPITDSLKRELERQIESIKTYVGWINGDVEAFNANLEGPARTAIENRRDKVLADQNAVAALGVPLRRPEDAAKTYPAPTIRRTPSPATKRAGTLSSSPEPAMLSEDYEHILGVLKGMSHVFERSPKDFAGLDEEAVRQHFLVQLNGHYKGAATGETFNSEGKTDILVREGDRNVFIGECKFWDGAKVLTETIDQVLRYASWRDTKTAILLFNRNRDLTRVLAQISPTVVEHPSFVREINYGGETEFRFLLLRPDDKERELTLTVLVFEVPA